MCKNVCLSLFDERGKEIFAKWYNSIRSAQVRKSELTQTMYKAGYTWVVWTFNRLGKRVLLNSSRPLPFVVCEYSELI